jgi:hypothetical protein
MCLELCTDKVVSVLCVTFQEIYGVATWVEPCGPVVSFAACSVVKKKRERKQSSEDC